MDEDDIDMIQDLILFNRDDLERNSWEWVHKDEVEEAEERFEEDPYIFVIDYNWPYPEGIVLAAASTNQILGDNDKYFTFRSTKIGDIIATTEFITSTNDWVCGSGAYLTGGDLVTRSTDLSFSKQIRKGSKIQLDILIDTDEEIFAIELPVSFQEDQLSLTNLVFQEHFTPRWYRNRTTGTLVFSDYNKDLSPLGVTSGVIASLELAAIIDITDLSHVFRWHPDRRIEIIGENGNGIYPDVRFEVKRIIPPDFYAEIRSSGKNEYILHIETPRDKKVNLFVLSMDGGEMHSQFIGLTKGHNQILLPNSLNPGMYICRLDGDFREAIKWIKLQ